MSLSCLLAHLLSLCCLCLYNATRAHHTRAYSAELEQQSATHQLDILERKRFLENMLGSYDAKKIELQRLHAQELAARDEAVSSLAQLPCCRVVCM